MRRDDYLKKKNGFFRCGPATSKTVYKHLKRYAYNLLGKINLTSESLTFFFSLQEPQNLISIHTEISQLLPDDSNRSKSRFKNDYDIYRLIEIIEELPQQYSPRKCRFYENKIIDIMKNDIREGNDKEQAFPKELNVLSETFDLTQIETEIVLFHFILSRNNEFSDLYDQFEGTYCSHFIAAAADLSIRAVREALDQEGKLLSLKILDAAVTHGRSSALRSFELSDIFVTYLSGLDSKTFRRDLFFEDHKQTFPLGDFSVSRDSVDVLTELITRDGPGNILLYGKPGTGKTELARAVIKNSGKRCYFLKSRKLPENNRFNANNPDRILLLQLAVNLIEDNHAVLVVDEADTILNTANVFSLFFGGGSSKDGEKGQINTIMDNHDKKIMWITNSIRGIEDSVLRRFNYSIQFRQNSASQRIRYWDNLIKKYKLTTRIDTDTIKSLAAAYKINAGHIGKALETYAHLPKTEASIERLTEILDRQDELIHYGNSSQKNNYQTHSHFEMKFLNTDIPVDRMMNSITHTLDRDSDHTASYLLLYGIPGTGKTEFARYIAQRLGKELLLKRSSDILSPWVGENERNIKDAFSEAEADGAVLCIDEADSFFRARRSARASWEVSFTNELLTQMETFRGVFIATTNLAEILDPAVMRRFSWKIKFLSLKKDHRIEIVQRYFALPSLPDAERSAFREITGLTPGDVKAVWLKYGSSPRLSPIELAEELARETDFRRDNDRQIGFAPFD